MIIEKTYNFNEIPKEYFLFPMTFRDYHNKILTDIVRETHKFILEKVINPVIVTGIDGYMMISDSNSFTFTPPNILPTNFVGLLMGKKIYYNIELEPDKVIIGNNVDEVIHYIKTKGRKQKLQKLENSILMNKRD